MQSGLQVTYSKVTALASIHYFYVQCPVQDEIGDLTNDTGVGILGYSSCDDGISTAMFNFTQTLVRIRKIHNY